MGSCTRGSKCRFLHVEQTGGKKSRKRPGKQWRDEKKDFTSKRVRRSVVSHISMPGPSCPTHLKKCVLRKVMKRGKNYGRQYYSCAVDLDEEVQERCGFFRWKTDTGGSKSGRVEEKRPSKKKKEEKEIAAEEVAVSAPTDKKEAEEEGDWSSHEDDVVIVEEHEEDDDVSVDILDELTLRSKIQQMLSTANLSAREILKFTTSGSDKKEKKDPANDGSDAEAAAATSSESAKKKKKKTKKKKKKKKTKKKEN